MASTSAGSEVGNVRPTIGMIGAGNIGGTLARLFGAAGYPVLVSNSRGPDTLVDLVSSLGGGARAVTGDEAVEASDIVVVSVPLRAYAAVPVPEVPGTIVIDTNNYYPDRDGHFAELDDDRTTSSEILANHLPGARVVKAFNTIYFVHLAEQGVPAGAPGRRALPIAGDDPEAKAVVSALIDEIGFDVVDAGPLAAGRDLQPGHPAYGAEMQAAELAATLGISG